MKSKLFILNRIIFISFIVFFLKGCASNKKMQAPINSISSELLSSNDKMITRSKIVDSNSFSLESRNYTNLKKKFIIYDRNYKNLPKGRYVDKTYIVKKGDTIFYIAWITGNDFRDLAKKNNITVPYNNLKIGQVLQINNTSLSVTNNNTIAVTNIIQEDIKNHSNSEKLKISKVLKKGIFKYSNDLEKAEDRDKKLPLRKSVKITALESTKSTINTTVNVLPVSRWHWPTDGRIIDSFSNTERGNKGIDIEGIRGQPIVVTASGRVVYAGNALRGYGNLIIIKHNEDYLSAYAHNDKIFVKEKQEVKIGQKIATMGSTGTSSVRLHFEIRYRGKPVNPLHYLS